MHSGKGVLPASQASNRALTYNYRYEPDRENFHIAEIAFFRVLPMYRTR